MLQHVLKTVTMMWLMNNVMKNYMGGPKPGPPSFDAAAGGGGAGGLVGGDGLWNGPVRMLWHEGTPMVRIRGGREGGREEWFDYIVACGLFDC